MEPISGYKKHIPSIQFHAANRDEKQNSRLNMVDKPGLYKASMYPSGFFNSDERTILDSAHSDAVITVIAYIGKLDIYQFLC